MAITTANMTMHVCVGGELKTFIYQSMNPNYRHPVEYAGMVVGFLDQLNGNLHFRKLSGEKGWGTISEDKEPTDLKAFHLLGAFKP